MDIERLKELREETDQYRAVADDRCMSTSYEDDLLKLIDAEIARQSATEKVVCPDCNGSGAYQEYDEYDRYYVYACGKCDGSGEIARQSATSEEVVEAIKDLTTLSNMWQEIGQLTKELEVAITALQAYQPTTRKDRIVEEVAIPKTETTKVKTVEIPAPREILKGDWGGK